MGGKLIYVDQMIKDLNAMKRLYDAIALSGMIKALKEAPAVDAVEVVRCRQCCFGVKKRERGEVVTYCGLFWGMRGVLDPDSFCSYGKEINDAKID